MKFLERLNEMILNAFIENCPENIKKYFVRKIFKKDEAIILQGDNDRYIYFIIKGQIKVFSILQNGEQYVLTYLSAVDIVGEVESLTPSHKAVSMVKAVTETEALRLEKSIFLKWMQEDWEFAHYIMSSLAERIFYITENTVMRYITTVDQRLDILIKHARAENKKEIEKSYIFNQLFTTRRSFNRSIKKMHDQKKINIKGSKILLE